MAKVRIDRNQPLNPGDRVELHFRSTGLAWIKAIQIALLERNLSGRSDFELISVACPADEPTKVIIVVEVKSGPAAGFAAAGVVVTCASIAALIITAGIIYKLTLEDSFLLVKEVVTSPAGQIGIGGMGIGLAAAGIIALLALMKK